MRLFIKILLFVFAALIANVKVMNAATTFPDIQETTTSSSFHTEIVAKAVFKISENDLASCCQNGQNSVDYRNWGIGFEADAAKWVTTVTKQAATISKQVGKNSISIRTPNRTLHFDLQGATHKGVPTPHIQQSLPNVNPKTGQVFLNKDRQ